jgi:hypothetical protein
MKKLATWMLVLCVGLFMFSGCGDDTSKKPKADDKAKDKGTTP